VRLYNLYRMYVPFAARQGLASGFLVQVCGRGRHCSFRRRWRTVGVIGWRPPLAPFLWPPATRQGALSPPRPSRCRPAPPQGWSGRRRCRLPGGPCKWAAVHAASMPRRFGKSPLCSRRRFKPKMAPAEPAPAGSVEHDCRWRGGYVASFMLVVLASGRPGAFQPGRRRTWRSRIALAAPNFSDAARRRWRRPNFNIPSCFGPGAGHSHARAV